MLPRRELVVKLFTIAAHAFNKLSSSAFNIIISIIVIRIFSQELWGEFITLSLAVNLALQVISWGHKDYLIKAFSQNPSKVAALWQQTFISRFSLYVLSIPVFVLLLNISTDVKIGLIVWAFTLYIYRSFDVLILYHRNFNLSTLLESFGYSILILCIFIFKSDFSILYLLWINILITLFKSIYLLFFYRNVVFQPVSLKLNLAFFRDAFPFFLPSVIGFVQSKADMYVVAYSLSQSKLAEYQIFISLLSVIHQVVLLAITPFSKNMYRLKHQVIDRFAWKFFGWGLIVSTLGLPVIYLIVTFYYQFILGWSVYGMGFLIMPPLFFYSIKTYQWFKHNAQYSVVAINFLMAIVTLLLSITLIPLWGITGALAASCAAQWMAFFIFTRKLIKQKVQYEHT